jgi:PAT family beta-lactamase induction signal transducer AmpG
MFALGFASGLPYQLIRDVPRAWLTELHASKADIGSLGRLAFPATIKFLWAPLLDRYVPPWLGRRRGWIVIFQVLLAGAIWMMGRTGGQLDKLLAVGLVVAVFSASQDIAADAYRTDLLPPKERASGTSYWVVSFKLATIAMGGGLLGLVGKFGIGWPGAFAIAAGGMLACVAFTIAAPEPAGSVHRPTSLHQAIVLPVVELVTRHRGLLVLAFVFLFKIPEILAGLFSLTFLLEMKYTLDQVVLVKNGFGVAATVLGTLAGGAVVGRMGMRPGLVVMGLAGAVSNGGFLALAWTGKVAGLMPAVVCTESFCAGLVTASFVAFLMGQCDRRFSATHYAILSGLSGLSETVLGRPAGSMADRAGWAVFFAVSVIAVVPALVLVYWLPQTSGEGFNTKSTKAHEDTRTGDLP